MGTMHFSLEKQSLYGRCLHQNVQMPQEKLLGSENSWASEVQFEDERLEVVEVREMTTEQYRKRTGI